MEEPRPQRPRPPAARIIVIAALCGAAVGLLNFPGLRKADAPPSFLSPNLQTTAADAMYRLMVWMPETAARRGYGGVMRPTEWEEEALAALERLAPTASVHSEPVAMHRLGIIYGERGYRDQAIEMLGAAGATQRVDTEVCLALSTVYSGKPVPLDRLLPTAKLLAKQPRWWALRTEADLAKRAGFKVSEKALRDAAYDELTAVVGRWALVCGLVCVVMLTAGIALVLGVVRYLFSPDRAKVPFVSRLPRLEWLDILEVVAVVVCCNALGIALRRALGASGGTDLASAGLRAVQAVLVLVPGLALIARRAGGGSWRWMRALVVSAEGGPKLIFQGLVGAGCALGAVTALSAFVAPAPAVYTAAYPVCLLDVVLMVLVMPLGEELIFRGFVLQAMWQKLRPLAAASLSALFFAGAHLTISPNEFGGIFVFGMVAAVVFRKSRSLVPCFVLHACYNGLLIAAHLALRS